MKKALYINILLCLFSIVSFANTGESERFVDLTAPQSDQVDDCFGTNVADPYRGLEDADSETTRKWIEAENKLTFA